MFDSLPAESESQTEPSPAAEPAARVDEISTPAAPVAIPEPPRYDELMPWEEYALLEAAQAAAAANEPDHVADAGALDEWESALEGEGGEAVPAWGD
jgi:hypothetical protein